MNAIVTKLSGTALLCLIMLSLSACAVLKDTLQKPSVELLATRFENLTLNDANLVFKLKVSNPGALSIPVQALNYQLHINNKPVISGQHNERIKLPAQGEKVVDLPMTFHYSDVFSGIVDIFKYKQLAYQLKANLDLAYINIPFQTSGQLSLPSLPKLSVKKIRIKKLSLSSVQLGLDINVSNSNRFSIPLGGMDYRLTLNQQKVLQGRSNRGLQLKPGASSTQTLLLDVALSKLGGLLTQIKQGQPLRAEFAGEIESPFKAFGKQTIPLHWQGRL